MQIVRLAHETDFAGWRDAARALRVGQVPPEAVLWTVDAAAPALPPAAQPFPVPRGFLDLADKAVLHRSDERFALLYRLLWRLRDQPELLGHAGDPDVGRARLLAAQVGQAAQRMKADVRLQPTADATLYAAWFEPTHRVAEAVAPFFARRFAARRFSILTPDVCVHWNGRGLRFTPGADRADPPRPDAPELRRDPPRRVAGNLPETGLMPELIARAEARAEPSQRVVRAAPGLGGR